MRARYSRPRTAAMCIRGNPGAGRRVAFSMTTIGIIGAGHIGSQLARAFTGLGYDVVIASPGGPEPLTGRGAELGPTAGAATAEEAAAAADVAVVTVPLVAYPHVPVEPLAG